MVGRGNTESQAYTFGVSTSLGLYRGPLWTGVPSHLCSEGQHWGPYNMTLESRDLFEETCGHSLTA